MFEIFLKYDLSSDFCFSQTIVFISLHNSSKNSIKKSKSKYHILKKNITILHRFYY